jgi:hypothetical protein
MIKGIINDGHGHDKLPILFPINAGSANIEGKLVSIRVYVNDPPIALCVEFPEDIAIMYCLQDIANNAIKTYAKYLKSQKLP